MTKEKRICATCGKHNSKIECGYCFYCSQDCLEKIRNAAFYPYKSLTNKEYKKYHRTHER